MAKLDFFQGGSKKKEKIIKPQTNKKIPTNQDNTTCFSTLLVMTASQDFILPTTAESVFVHVLR